MSELHKFTQAEIEANWRFAETTFKDAFKDVPCPCPNCDLKQGDHQ